MKDANSPARRLGTRFHRVQYRLSKYYRTEICSFFIQKTRLDDIYTVYLQVHFLPLSSPFCDKLMW